MKRLLLALLMILLPLCGSAETTEPTNLPTYFFEENEVYIGEDEAWIFGVQMLPIIDDGDVKVPLVILSHGLGGSYEECLPYARKLASHGVSAFCFDFRNSGGMSDGEVTDMSVLTEVADLEEILKEAQQWEQIDPERIVLLGFSQGGLVSAITAAWHEEEIAGAVLYYPALIMAENLHKMFSTLDEVPDAFDFRWVRAGRIYVEDMWDFDVYGEVSQYTKKVLLFHGDADTIVPLSSSERAMEVYPDAELIVMPGAAHGFVGQAFEDSMLHVFRYFQEIGVLGE